MRSPSSMRPDSSNTSPDINKYPGRALPVAVIGGGLAGLTAAVELARGGREVIVFEQSSSLGGRAGTRQVSGYQFNMGPHALYAQGHARRILASYGVEIVGHPPPLKGGKALFDGTVDHLPIDAASLLRARWLPWAAKFQVLGLFARLPRLDPSPWEGKTVDQWLQTTLSHPRARHLFYALLRLGTYGAEPGNLDAALAIQQLQLGTVGGVLYLDGGWQRLVDGLERQAVAAGASLVTSQRVMAVTRLGESWQVEMKDGQHRPVAAAVLAVSPDKVLELLSTGSSTPQVLSSLVDRLRALRPIDAACLDVALQHLPRPQQLFALGIDQPHYFSVHTSVADLAPQGGALIHVMRCLEMGSTASRQDVERELEALLDTLQPGWRPQLVERQLMPRIRVSHGLHEVGVPRPSERLEELPGLYLAGDWVGDEGWLADAAVASGQKAARQLLARAETRSLAA